MLSHCSIFGQEIQDKGFENEVIGELNNERINHLMFSVARVALESSNFYNAMPEMAVLSYRVTFS